MVFGGFFWFYGQFLAPIYGPKHNLYIRFFLEIWSFRLNGQFLSGPNMDHISGTQCTIYHQIIPQLTRDLPQSRKKPARKTNVLQTLQPYTGLLAFSLPSEIQQALHAL